MSQLANQTHHTCVDVAYAFWQCLVLVTNTFYLGLNYMNYDWFDEGKIDCAFSRSQ